MNSIARVAVIGDKDSIQAFSAAGVSTFAAENLFVAKSTLRELVASGEYAVIFITEQLAVDISDYLEELKGLTYPCVLPIPSAGGSNGYGIRSIRRDIERAIGADIDGD